MGNSCYYGSQIFSEKDFIKLLNAEMTLLVFICFLVFFSFEMNNHKRKLTDNNIF